MRREPFPSVGKEDSLQPSRVGPPRRQEPCTKIMPGRSQGVGTGPRSCRSSRCWVACSRLVVGCHDADRSATRVLPTLFVVFRGVSCFEGVCFSEGGRGESKTRPPRSTAAAARLDESDAHVVLTFHDTVAERSAKEEGRAAQANIHHQNRSGPRSQIQRCDTASSTFL